MNCYKPIEVWPDGKKYIVPCGKCLACLTTKREDWSNRLLHEWRASTGALFITLTYHPKFYPDEGVSKRHLQLFIKRLRKYHGKNRKGIRYYAVGEYGTQTGRAHYHALLFNTENANEFIRKAWRYKGQEIGIVHIGQVTEASIKYCTKYVIQRSTYPSKLNRPFALMSRAYGLGAQYLTDEMIRYHRQGLRNYMYVYDERKRLPRYYKNVIWPRWTKRDEWMQIQVIYQDQDREIVQLLSRADMLVERIDNMLKLYDKGYEPSVIIADMRNAVMSRVKEKVAFTQTL